MAKDFSETREADGAFSNWKGVPGESDWPGSLSGLTIRRLQEGGVAQRNLHPEVQRELSNQVEFFQTQDIRHEPDLLSYVAQIWSSRKSKTLPTVPIFRVGTTSKRA